MCERLYDHAYIYRLFTKKPGVTRDGYDKYYFTGYTPSTLVTIMELNPIGLHIPLNTVEHQTASTWSVYAHNAMRVMAFNDVENPKITNYTRLKRKNTKLTNAVLCPYMIIMGKKRFHEETYWVTFGFFPFRWKKKIN